MVKTKQKSNSTFAVLDAGTSKIAAIIAETNKNGDLIVSNHSISEKGQEIRSRKNTAKYYIDRLENVVPVTSGKIVTVREVATSAKQKKSLLYQTLLAIGIKLLDKLILVL